MEPGRGLFTLPPELRLQIYTYILTFSSPLKLLTHTRGSPSTSLLRCCRLIHTEALPILYTSNQIALTRNDFCPLTPPTLRTPIPHPELVENILLANFGESIACATSSWEEGRCCACCDDGGAGLVERWRGMGRLKSVVVDYLQSPWKFARFRRKWRGEKLVEGGMGMYTLMLLMEGEGEGGGGEVRVTFLNSAVGLDLLQ